MTLRGFQGPRNPVSIPGVSQIDTYPQCRRNLPVTQGDRSGVYSTKTPARVFLPRRSTATPPANTEPSTVAASSVTFTLLR